MERRPLKRQLSENVVVRIRVDPNPVMTGVLLRLGQNTQGADHMKEDTGRKGAQEVSEETNPANNLILDF